MHLFYIALQLLKRFQIANKYFANQDDASQFISEIESVVDNKFEDKKEVLATKDFVKEEIAGVKKKVTTCEKRMLNRKPIL